MPIEVRIRKTGDHAAIITAVYAGVANTSSHRTGNWQQFLSKRGWGRVPRVWE